MKMLRILFSGLFLAVMLNVTTATETQAAKDHCWNAYTECTDMCWENFKDIPNPISLGACGNGCTIGYAACQIFL